MNKPTEKQLHALRAWKVSEAEIQKMDFQAASAKLTELINKKESKANAHPKEITLSPGTGVGAEYRRLIQTNSTLPYSDIEKRVTERLRKAKAMVNKEFPQMFETSDYLNLVAEITHQIFAEESMLKIQSNKESLVDRAKR